ncbi:hypothetical protein WICPIJ_003586 [Wickerhamomyces pijperi]|uniref:Nodulin-like domain-containing protein n=1 Tax=Wickerhamomyces pijperi TaxID=599730 RepID=A0A9P8TMV6_WICPI|nr:hypothetical protein WICPIJ_003586 [Wickerhamomyces pijperi]
MPNQLQKTGILVSCSLVGFCCGTLYLYSAYSPQLATKLNYSGTDSQFIAFCGLIGVALSGVPSGILIDSKGFILALIIGCTMISTGYICLKYQYDSLISDLKVSSFCIFLVGFGSTFINSTLIKCCAVTFPNNRGIATSFPIATYGLSAFAYSFFGNLLFKSDTSRFIGFLGYSTLVLCLIGAPCIYIADVNSNKGHTVRVASNGSSSRPSLADSRSVSGNIRIGSPSIELQDLSGLRPMHLVDQASGNKPPSINTAANDSTDSTKSEILKSLKFWLILLTLGLLAALGQMYIYSVGYMTKSLLLVKQASSELISSEQAFQVSVLSLANFSGRLLSGFIGDLISNSLKGSRSWNLMIPTVLILLVQIIGYNLQDYSKLWLESMLTGIGYGFTWSSIPQLLIELYGVSSFSFAWGVINLGPIVPGYYFTHLFGRIYDQNLVPADQTTGSAGVCLLGEICYSGTFKITIWFGVISVALAVWINLSNFFTGGSGGSSLYKRLSRN